MSFEKIETTLILIKPDGVEKNLTNEILGIFEENKFKILEQKELVPDKEIIDAHLSDCPDSFEKRAHLALKLCKSRNIDTSNTFMAEKSVPEIGEMLKVFYIDYLASGKVHAALLQGPNAIEDVKKLCGATFPSDAAEGTIRKIYGSDSFEICVKENRAARNIIHAPESREEAHHQIKVWFPSFSPETL